MATATQYDLDVFHRFESQVNSYGRSFPVSFEKAEDCFMYSTNGKRYIDFLMGAGSLNYGHNNRFLTKVMKDYIDEKGVLQGLDMYTPAKEEFLKTLNKVILEPRKLDYKTQFTGPTGTNAVEAALKLARKATGRHNIVAFTNGYHGMSQGSLACTGNAKSRKGAGMPLSGVDRIPFCNYLSDVDSLNYFEKFLGDPSSGYDIPAAVLLETVQGEGGLNVASNSWLRRVESICRKHEILLIVDDIQAGIGRTGTFFSFEPSDIKPNIVTLSKSLSASGLPMSVVLFDRDLDRFWSPGEHNGTFRGNNLAFSTATEALKRYWSTPDFQDQVVRKAKYLKNQLESIAAEYGDLFTLKGRGLMVGLSCKKPEVAALIKDQCFHNQLMVETCGPRDEVVKFFPALNAPEKVIGDAMEILRKSIEESL
eukprot:CAMPEP_0204842690 /NCGR_PEP_ID=MMETSP1346-20131115/47538_1 /ASSEMBLY_ACC=CAM_ASM_000771 /TAXON_ID=215587 /ORGANISM="Aplanochytrium stocchinoi, Strain GSBS06" /LENGTH=422 /DNA_ID=CAMNT_0051981703 /DNA_START=303 /DNA_END=1571 /DNA_ORIENTATION=+